MSHIGCDATSGGFALRNRFGKIDFPMHKEMAKETDVFRRIAKAFGDDWSGKALNKRCAERFVAMLPLAEGRSEICGSYKRNE